MKKRKRQTETGPAAAAASERSRTGVRSARTGLKPWHYALALLAALVVLLEVYGPALRGPFVFDDEYLPFTNRVLADQPMYRWIIALRPMLMFSYWVNYRISGMEPFTYHLFNVAFHAITGLLIYFIVRKLLGWAGTGGWLLEALSGFAAALFLLHPIQTESVAYVASRSEALSVMFFFGAFALFLYRRSAAISWPAAIGVLVLFGAAATTKEHAAVLPALLLLTDYFWSPEPDSRPLDRIRRNWRIYVPIAVGGAIAVRLIWNVLRMSDSAGFGLKEVTWYEYFLTQCRAIWVYIRLFFLPYGQTLDHDAPFSRTLLDHGAVFGLLGLLAVAAAAIVWRRRYPLASYGTLVFLLLLAPTSSFVPIADAIVERRMYLPMIGLLLVIVEFLRRWRAGRGALAGSLAAVLIVAGWLTLQRNRLWGDEIALWQDAVDKTPRNSRAQFQLAFANYKQGRCDVALRHFETVAQISKPDYRLLIDWGLVYDCLNRPEEAVDKLRQAAALNRTAQAYASIGMVYAKRRMREPALEALNTAIEIDPNFEMTYVYRGNVYYMHGEVKEALEDYNRALRINPKSEAALEAIATVRRRLNTVR